MAATPIQGSCCSTISVVCIRRCFAISRDERKQSQEKLLELFPDLLYCVYLFLGKKEAFELPSVAFLRPSTGRLCPYNPSFSNRLYPLRVRTLQRPSLFLSRASFLHPLYFLRSLSYKLALIVFPTRSHACMACFLKPQQPVHSCHYPLAAIVTASHCHSNCFSAFLPLSISPSNLQTLSPRAVPLLCYYYLESLCYYYCKLTRCFCAFVLMRNCSAGRVHRDDDRRCDMTASRSAMKHNHPRGRISIIFFNSC